MSAPHDVLIVLTAIDMTRTKPTQEQLSAYFFNNCDPNEALFVENWFYHHGKSSEATELLHQLWVELGANEFHEDIPDIEDAFENFKSRLFTLQPVKQKPSLYQRLQLWFKRSAVVMFIPLITSTIALYIFNHRHGNIQWVEKTVAYGEIEKLNLPDGSVVWLNSGSTIIYPSDFLPDVRQVFFEGEGYFDVVTQKDETGREVTTYKQSVDMAMAFDYDMLSSHYNINLEVSNTTEPDEFSK